MTDIVNINIFLKFVISTDECLIINNIYVILYYLLTKQKICNSYVGYQC